MTPTKRDPRILAKEAEEHAEPVSTQPPTPIQPAQPPKPGTAQHTEEMQGLLAKMQDLERQLAEAKAARFGGGLPRELGLRVGPKGVVSVYGIHANFPISLYPDQWQRVFENQGKITEFIEANTDLLDFKDDDDQTLAEKQAKRDQAGIVPRKIVRREMVATSANVRKAA